MSAPWGERAITEAALISLIPLAVTLILPSPLSLLPETHEASFKPPFFALQ